jgi:D-inositol-3-phosphate glycosyltransferase
VPSRSESFGLVALEAGACGTPVVAAAVGGLTTLVEDGATGFLIEGRDVRSFAAAVERLATEPGLAGEMGAAAAKLAASYTWATAATRLCEVYEELTARALVLC